MVKNIRGYKALRYKILFPAITIEGTHLRRHDFVQVEFATIIVSQWPILNDVRMAPLILR